MTLQIKRMKKKRKWKRNRWEGISKSFQQECGKEAEKKNYSKAGMVSNHDQDREVPPNKPVGGEEYCRSTEGPPNPLKGAGWLLLGMGLPISPGTMLPR